MTSPRSVCTVVAAGAVLIFMGCNKQTDPAGPIPPARSVIFSEGFETDLANYSQVTYMPGWSIMSISTAAAHASSAQSLTSDTNLSGIKRAFYPGIEDSIAGLEFYLMAKQAGQTDFYVALATSGSSFNGLFTIMGMGIDKSDSLWYIYENTPTDSASMEHTNFAPLGFNIWYKCNIEYEFSTSTLTYSLNDSVIHTRTVPTTNAIPLFVAMRDSVGAQGPKEYYIDDVTVYKR
jgi:hypothetical protein